MRNFLLLLLLVSSSSYASTSRTTSVDLPALGISAMSPRDAASPVRIELLASSWEPASLSFESRARETGAFSASVMPRVSASVLSRLGSPSIGDLSLRTGIGFLPMEREGKITYSVTTYTESQSLYLIPLQAGLHFEPSLLRWKALSMHFGATAVPTIAILSKSALGESQTQTGMGYELAAGGALNLGALSSGYRGTEVTASVTQNYGKVKQSDLSGFALQAGLRLEI